MKKFAMLLLAGVLAFSPITARAAETGTAGNASFNLSLSGLTDLLGSDKLQSLNLDSLDLRKLDIDSLVQKARTNEFVKNLDVSTLNLDAAVGLLKDTDVLKTLGLEKLDMGEILKLLKDETITKQVLDWAASAAKGESIAKSVKAFLKSDSIRESITKIVGGKELSSLITGVDTKGLSPLLQKGVTALLSEKQEAAEAELTEEEKQESEIAGAAGSLLENSLKALLGK